MRYSALLSLLFIGALAHTRLEHTEHGQRTIIQKLDKVSRKDTKHPLK